MSRGTMSRRCEECGTEFLARSAEVKRGFGRLCSKRCARSRGGKKGAVTVAARRRSHIQVTGSTRELVYVRIGKRNRACVRVACVFCGNEFWARALQAEPGKFCSRLCATRWINDAYAREPWLRFTFACWPKIKLLAMVRQNALTAHQVGFGIGVFSKYSEHQWTENDKLRARRAVLRALKSGRLKRENCERCGAVKPHAHHDDYARPLSVRWLCPRCHHQHHSAVAAARAAEVRHAR